MHHGLYICREDGLLRYLEIGQGDELVLQTSSRAGTLPCHVTTAFASLDLGVRHYDILMAGGHMSQGGFYLVRLPDLVIPWAI